jgi:hypothetical protein
MFDTRLKAYSTSIEKNENILNLKKKNWYHPSDIKNKHNKSITDLIDNANKECIKTINEILKYLHNERNDLNDIIKDIDYSTGLEIKDNKKMRYFEY